MEFLKKYWPYVIGAAISLGLTGTGAVGVVKDLKAKQTAEFDNHSEDLDNIIETYNIYINTIANSIQELDGNRNILNDFAIYETMLKEGYLSYNKEGDTPTDVEIPGVYGANVAAGYTNELSTIHNAFNMVDVFNALGYKSKIVIGKMYHISEAIPENDNYAIVYVSNGKKDYLIDPTKGTILLKNNYMEYYTAESQEDDIECFLPNSSYNGEYGSIECTQLKTDLLGREFNKHWKVLREYRTYLENAQNPAITKFELDELIPFEEDINEYFDRLEKKNAPEIGRHRR